MSSPCPPPPNDGREADPPEPEALATALDALTDQRAAHHPEAEVTLAALTETLLAHDPTPMPDALRARLEADGQAFLRPPPARARERPSSPPSWLALLLGLALGTAATAAILLVARPDLRPPSTRADGPSPAEALQADPATLALRLTRPNGQAVGRLWWNTPRQEGWIELTGLPANDPAESQYQLWIVDPLRDSTHPIDAGVFDVPATSGPGFAFRPRLPVSAPTAFAVTREQPGGVVVARGSPVLLAAVPR